MSEDLSRQSYRRAGFAELCACVQSLATVWAAAVQDDLLRSAVLGLGIPLWLLLADAWRRG